MLTDVLLQVFAPMNLLLVFSGTLLGIAAGILPGLTATLSIALVLPFTFALSPVEGMALILGVYVGAVTGGSITALLINVPGTPASIMTGVEGNALVKQGKSGLAFGTMITSSVFGGLVSCLLLIFIAPILGKFAIKLGPPEYFAIGILALALVAGLLSSNVIKGLIAAAIGLSITLIGTDPILGVKIFTFGSRELIGGIELVPILVGLFGFKEVLVQLRGTEVRIDSIKQISNKITMPFKKLKTIIPSILRGTAIGSYVGFLPGAGAPIAAFMSYDSTKRVNSKETFGNGNLKGLASVESANNATTGTTLIPLLTLGIPGDGATAVMLGAFTMQNVIPGPTIFTEEPTLVGSIYINLIIANIVMAIALFLSAKYFIKVLSIPTTALMAVVALLCIVGSFAIRGSLFDVGVMLTAGIVGYFLQQRGFPSIPIILGVILGPIIIPKFRTALAIDPSGLIFLTKPVSLIAFILAFLILFWPLIKKILPSRKSSVS